MKTCTYETLHANIYSIILFIISKLWKTTKIWYSWLFGNTNEELIYVTMWLNLENNLLCERSESQKTDGVWFHLYKVEWMDNSIEILSRLLFASSWEDWGVEWGISANLNGVSFGGNEKVLKLDMMSVLKFCIYI